MGRIVFFRHAQASAMKANYDQLSDLGIEQAKVLGKYLVDKNIRFDRIYSGTLERQKHTAELVREAFLANNVNPADRIEMEAFNEHHGPKAMKAIYQDLIQQDAQMAQWHTEILEDPQKRKKNFMLMFQAFMKQWIQGNIEVPHDDVESWLSFRDRVKKGVAQIREAGQKGENIAVFTSGGTISAIVGEYMAVPEEYQIVQLNFIVRNASITQFLFSEKEFNLLSFNEIPHLESEMITFV